MGSGTPPWQSAFTKWAMEDRHSQAYTVLFGSLAEQIVANLNRPSGKPGAPAYADSRCLGCHTTENPGREQDHEFVMDGVGCEACHGAAEQWLARHTATGWTPMHGMLDTKNAAVRAQQCVQCHVGAGPRGDGATRDVNHDLIAAGHPRLAFELHSYLQAMPPHWATEKKDKLNEDPLHVWAVGRIVALTAALELRGERWTAASTSAPGAHLQPVWPEFAELDCYSCHRPFQRGEGYHWPVAAKTSSSRKLGQPTPNVWYETMMGEVLNDLAPDQKIVFGTSEAWYPWDEPKLDAIHTTAGALNEIADRLAISKLVSEQLTTVIGLEKIDTGNWDQAAQAYLAIAALAARTQPTLKKEQQRELESALAALKAAVQFSANDSAAEPGHFDSPREYSPEAFQAAFDRLVEMLKD